LLHALDSDHVAAVTTIVASGKGPKRAMAIGAWWGAGHAAAVLGAGALLVALGAHMPERLALLFDAIVVFMLAGLGVGALWRAKRARSSSSAPGAHAHPHLHQPARTPLRALAVGLVHGASGTALPGLAQRYAYLFLFAGGAALGMTLLSALLALSIGAAARRFALPLRVMYVAAGCLSIGSAAALLRELVAGLAT
jgi:hypothetical protein